MAAGSLFAGRRIVPAVSGFLDRMIDANRALLDLDAMELGSDALSICFALEDAVFVYQELCALQNSPHLTQVESVKLQLVLDRLRARLRFFGDRT
jgi:hypothetical protein